MKFNFKFKKSRISLLPFTYGHSKFIHWATFEGPLQSRNTFSVTAKFDISIISVILVFDIKLMLM